MSHGCLPDAATVALVTEKVSENVGHALAAAGWSVILVETITSTHSSVVEERWRDNYSKLHLFALQVPRRANFLARSATEKRLLSTGRRSMERSCSSTQMPSCSATCR